MIELLAGFPDGVVGFSCTGQVTTADYEAVLVPAIVKALETRKRLRLYLAAPPGFSGIDVGAAWDDLKLAIGHRASWERVAVVTDIHWIEQATRFYNTFIHCPMKTFVTAEAAQARRWIATAD